jgi:hypothetical protein
MDISWSSGRMPSIWPMLTRSVLENEEEFKSNLSSLFPEDCCNKRIDPESEVDSLLEPIGLKEPSSLVCWTSIKRR